ncbi:MAG: ribonuclease E/G, partial [Paracoccaceae bacterium]
QIAVDFVSMSKANRKQLEQALRAAFKADAIETSLVGWTTMGLYEMQRKRERLPLSEVLP